MWCGFFSMCQAGQHYFSLQNSANSSDNKQQHHSVQNYWDSSSGVTSHLARIFAWQVPEHELSYWDINLDFLDIKQNHQMSRPIIQQTIIINICVRFLKFRPFMKRWMDFSKTPLMLQTSRMTKTDFPPFYFPRGSHEAVLGMYVVRAQGGPI